MNSILYRYKKVRNQSDLTIFAIRWAGLPRGDAFMQEIPRREFITTGGLGDLLRQPTRLCFSSAVRRGSRQMDRSAAAEPGSGGHQESARLGGPRFLGNAERQVLFNRAFQPAGHRRKHVEARNRRPGQKAVGPDARRHQGPAAPGSHVHDRMFGQSLASRFSTAASAMRAGRARRSPRS